MNTSANKISVSYVVLSSIRDSFKKWTNHATGCVFNHVEPKKTYGKMSLSIFTRVVNNFVNKLWFRKKINQLINYFVWHSCSNI